MNKNKKIIIIVVAVISVVWVFNYAKNTIAGIMMSKAMRKPPNVEVTNVTAEKIQDKLSAAGRLEAKYSVDIVARIQGEIEKSYFSEGSNVKKGALLFLIEPDNYQIAKNQAAAELKRAQADYTNSQKELKRALELVKLDYVSKSYYDQALAKRDMAKATVDSAVANLANANLQLSYTRIYSPVEGKIGKILITQGNLVDVTSGTIAKVVSLNPIYAYFSIKSEDYLRFRKNTENSIKDCVIGLKLADGTLYKYTGAIEFVNNEVDPSAGTIGLRATFPNPGNVLLPGDYVDVTITAVKPRNVILISQDAVQETKEGMLVYTLGEDNKAVPAIITTDGQYEGKWVVTNGLKEGDKVIYKGLLNVRPNIKVNVLEPASAEDEAKLDKLK